MPDDGRKAVEEFDATWQVQEKVLKPIFGKYLTRNAGFVEYLNDIRNQIETYINRLSVKRPLNILLAAAPGNGKSFLIKQLINSIETDLEVAFEEIYIPSLENVNQLYTVFQRIQSINLEGKVPAVFFDEIDSPIGQSFLYAKFLAPMWDGTFYIGKDRYFLGKSVFFFAGSTLSLEGDSKQIIDDASGLSIPYHDYADRWKSKFDIHIQTNKDKLPDFIDRIDATIRIPPVRKELLGDNWILEYEDIACMLVLKHFPSIKVIGKLALERICQELIAGNSLRSAEKIVFNSRPEDGERFDISSLPRGIDLLNLPQINSKQDGKLA
jgi:hypothetical protein